MRTGSMLLITAAALSCAACLSDGGKLEVRSVNGGLRANDEPVPYRIAEARAQLALGNFALALEGFRKAEREDPTSIEAVAGMAQCYDQIGRFDLSRRYYEQALAIAPRDPALLELLAASFERQGLRGEADNVRREIAGLARIETAEPVEVAQADPAAVHPEVTAPVGQSVTIALPPARPVEGPAAKARPKEMAVAPIGKSVTIALAPARPVEAAPGVGPRLERLSLTEVALFTGNGPRWKRPTQEPVRMARRPQPAQLAELRILNAARVEKLAARTRSYLGDFGWRAVAVGDAEAVRQRSLIVYPKGTQAAANRLAARLGFATSQRDDVRQLTVLLGRDAAGHPALRPKA